MWYYNEPKSGRIASGTYKDLPCIGEGLDLSLQRFARIQIVGSRHSARKNYHVCFIKFNV